MQSARKSSPDDNIDDFLGYIEIPVKVLSKALKCSYAASIAIEKLHENVFKTF